MCVGGMGRRVAGYFNVAYCGIACRTVSSYIHPAPSSFFKLATQGVSTRLGPRRIRRCVRFATEGCRLDSKMSVHEVRIAPQRVGRAFKHHVTIVQHIATMRQAERGMYVLLDDDDGSSFAGDLPADADQILHDQRC